MVPTGPGQPIPPSEEPAGRFRGSISSEELEGSFPVARMTSRSPRPRHRPVSSSEGQIRQPGSVGGVQTAFVLIEAQPDRIAQLAGELAAVDGVAEAYSVAGDADLVAIVRVRHMDDLADVVTGRIGALAGIVGTRTMVAFKAYSQADVAAMWDLGTD